MIIICSSAGSRMSLGDGKDLPAKWKREDLWIGNKESLKSLEGSQKNKV